MVTDAKNFLGDWDMCDPVVWAILRVVHAQNDLTYAIDVVANNYNTASPRAVEAAISERREAIAALGQVLKQRGIPMKRRWRGRDRGLWGRRSALPTMLASTRKTPGIAATPWETSRKLSRTSPWSAPRSTWTARWGPADHETRVVERRCRPRNAVSRLIRAGAPSA